MFNLLGRGSKVAPSPYPRVLFHGIRLFQLLASLVVGAIMLYFIWHLTHDHWATPWTFIWLTSASLFSIAALLVTMVLHCFIGLHPRLSLFVNSSLAALWALSWSLLTWYMSGTLINACDLAHWNEDAGIMVCRLYKTLFSFTLLGLLSTLAALTLDLYVHRQVSRRGVYRLPDLDEKRGGTAFAMTSRSGANTLADPAASNANGSRDASDAPRVSEAWEVPRTSMGPYGERGLDDNDDGDLGASSPAADAKSGYRVPEGQFEYDTAYRGYGGPGARQEAGGVGLYDGPAGRS